MRILLLLSFLAVSTLSGAEKGARTFRVLYLDAPRDAPRITYLFDGKASQEIELPRMNLSPVYELSASVQTIVLSQTPYTSIEEVNPKAPQAKIPEGVADFYLLIGTDKDNPVAPLVPKIVPLEKSSFKTGGMLWFNLTDNVVGGKVGSQRLMMKPLSQQVVKAPSSRNEGYIVDLAFQQPGDEELYPLCETKWIHDPKSRMVVFVTGTEHSSTLRVRGVTDFRG